MHIVVGSVALVVLGVMHLAFVFNEPPTVLEPFVNYSSRKLRYLLVMVPDGHRTMASRLLVGTSFTAIGILWLIRRLG